MTYEEIAAKIEGCRRFSVTEIKEIPHGKSLRLSNGGIINCYNSGSHVIQGKAQEEVKAVMFLFGKKRKIWKAQYMPYRSYIVLSGKQTDKLEFDEKV